MPLFTPKEILDTGELFRSVSPGNRNLISGIMIGHNTAEDPTTLPEMINVAMTLINSGKPA